ncbi:TM2 domain-containing protein [Uliginosibacterium sp. sgz301328]|uniref:TM2 domain-containing protein n=1 Tax=Uliginosibacterium sp. sgz301328 TaxID=3243764 RepID=UPI00359E2A66
MNTHSSSLVTAAVARTRQLPVRWPPRSTRPFLPACARCARFDARTSRTLWLLWATLGWAGAHRLYMDKVASGLAVLIGAMLLALGQAWRPALIGAAAPAVAATGLPWAVTGAHVLLAVLDAGVLGLIALWLFDVANVRHWARQLERNASTEAQVPRHPLCHIECRSECAVHRADATLRGRRA